MHKPTKHIQKRMAERGISGRLVQLALEYGEICQDKYVLSRRLIDVALEQNAAEHAALLRARRCCSHLVAAHIDDALRCSEDERRTLLKARDCGGHTVVVADGELTTTYRTEGYRKPRGGR